MFVEMPGASEAGIVPGENLAVSPLAADSEVRCSVFDAPVLAMARVCVAAAPGAIAPNTSEAGADRLGSSAGPDTPWTITSSTAQL